MSAVVKRSGIVFLFALLAGTLPVLASASDHREVATLSGVVKHATESPAFHGPGYGQA